jgi:hypothetical protein
MEEFVMSWLRLILTGLSAAVTLTAVASTSASAEVPLCKEGEPTLAVCSGSHQLGSPPVPFSGTGGVSLVAATIGGAEVKLECKIFEVKGNFTLLGQGEGSIVLFECKMILPANCKLTAPEEEKIEMKSIGAMIGTMGSAKVEFTGQGPGEQFYMIEIPSGGGCAIAGKYTVTGKQDCELPKIEEELVEHEVICKKSGSKLKAGTEAVTISGKSQNVHTTGSFTGLKWYVGLSK